MIITEEGDIIEINDIVTQILFGSTATYPFNIKFSNGKQIYDCYIDNINPCEFQMERNGHLYYYVSYSQLHEPYYKIVTIVFTTKNNLASDKISLSSNKIHFRFSSKENSSNTQITLINSGEYVSYWRIDELASYGITTTPLSGAISAKSEMEITATIDVQLQLNESDRIFYLSIIPDNDNLQCFSRIFLGSTYELADCTSDDYIPEQQCDGFSAVIHYKKSPNSKCYDGKETPSDYKFQCSSMTILNGTPMTLLDVLLCLFAVYVVVYSVFLFFRRVVIRKFISLEIVGLLVIGGLLTILSGYASMLTVEQNVCIIHNWFLTTGLLWQTMYFFILLFLYYYIIKYYLFYYNRAYELYTQEIILTYIKKRVALQSTISRILQTFIPGWAFHSLYFIILLFYYIYF